MSSVQKYQGLWVSNSGAVPTSRFKGTWEGVVTSIYWHGSWREGHFETDSDLGLRDTARLG